MHLINEQRGAVNDEIPFGLPPGEESHGCTAGFPDAVTDPEDKGSSEPQPQEDNERALMASLKDTLVKRAARIERETGGDCRIDALISSSGSGADGFLVVLTVAGCRGLGNAASLDDAELQARLECSVQLAQVRKAIAEACDVAAAAAERTAL